MLWHLLVCRNNPHAKLPKVCPALRMCPSPSFYLHGTMACRVWCRGEFRSQNSVDVYKLKVHR